MRNSTALPVVCDPHDLPGKILQNYTLDGHVLKITPNGAVYNGWSISWPQLILTLQDAARNAQYVKALPDA